MTKELVEKLRDAVTYGYMPRLMREIARQAANTIEAQAAEIERLTSDGIRTCHDDCPRLPCVQRREIDGLRADVRHLMNELQAHKDALAQADPKP
jgi:phage terminase Nu1 subunit (DNA packaging protein)